MALSGSWRASPRIKSPTVASVHQRCRPGPLRGTDSRRVRVAQTAVVSLGPRDDVFDVVVPLRVERLARVGAVDGAAELVDDLVLDGLRIRVVVRIVGRTAILSCDLKTSPSGRLTSLASNDLGAQRVDGERSDRFAERYTPVRRRLGTILTVDGRQGRDGFHEVAGQYCVALARMARVRRRRQPPFLPQLIDSLADLLDMDSPDRRLSGHHRIVGPGLLRTGDTRNQYDQRDGRQPRSYSHAAPSLDDAVDGRALVGAFGGLDPEPCGRAGPASFARSRAAAIAIDALEAARPRLEELG